MPTRRTLMKIGGAALLPAAAIGGSALAANAQARTAGSARAAVPPFSVPLPMLSVLSPVARTATTDFYALTSRRAQVEILPGVQTEIFGYGGEFPGPVIHAKVGRRVVVSHTNQLDMPTAVHLHGGHTPARSDGFPTDVIEPGATKVYEYPNRQRAASLWYHDHAHHMEAEHVFRGLSGMYLLSDPAEEKLRLPSGSYYDVPIMLRDARFAEDGSLLFVDDDFENRNTILANGKPQPYFSVAGRKYRLRVANSSNLRTFILTLGAGEEVTQIGSDGGLLGAPAPTRAVVLSPGERADLVVDFGRYPIGTQLVLNDQLAGPVLRFDVDRRSTDHSRVPAVLRPLPSLSAAAVTRQFTLGLDPQDFQFKINGKVFDPDRVDTVIKKGATEIWEVTNLDTTFGIPHNFHIHMVQFRVVTRDGQPPAPSESGWKDTVPVLPGETVRLQATFADYAGRYVYHCHLLDHSSHGMMATMQITD